MYFSIKRAVVSLVVAGMTVHMASVTMAAPKLKFTTFNRLDNEFYSWKSVGKKARPYTGPGEEPFKALTMPALTSQEKVRGFVVFRTHWMERSFPVTVPSRDQISDHISIFATPGEFEPATFLIRPQKDLKTVLIRMDGDLVGAAGGHIPADNVRLGIVNGFLDYSGHPIRWAIAPIREIDIDKDYSEQFWITVKVPEDARPDTYRGTLVIQVAGSQAHRLGLEVKVLPIKLARPDAAFGMYFSQGFVPDRWISADYMEKCYRDMAEHGMTSVIFYCEWPGQMTDGVSGETPGTVRPITYDFKHNHWWGKEQPHHYIGLDVMGEAAQKSGLLHKDIPIMYLGCALDSRAISKRHKELNIAGSVANGSGVMTVEDATVISAHAKTKGWPELLFYVLDEWDGFDPYKGGREMLFMREVVRPLKEAGFRTVDAEVAVYRKKSYENWFLKNRKADKHEYVLDKDGYVVDEPLLENIYYWLDITLMQTRGGMWAPALDKLRSLGKDYWGYDCAEIGIAPQSDRFMFGLYCWRTGAKGFWQWAYTGSTTKAGKRYWTWMDEEGRFHNSAVARYCYVVLSPQGPIPTIGWEGKREGVDDYRYLLTLSRLIAKARKHSNQQTNKLAAEAQSVIDKMMKNIPIDTYTRRYYKSVGGGFVNPLPALASSDYDRFRRTLADWIIRLQSQMKGK